MSHARTIPTLIAVLCVLSPTANAALPSNALLTFGGNSWFNMDSTGNVLITPGPDGGVILGVAQTASGSHNGLPDGSEHPTIDAPWGFLGNTGMTSTDGPVTILSDDGAGNVTLDLSHWGIIWNGGSFSAGANAATGDNGVATLTCNASCGIGDSFVLDYSTHMSEGQFSGVQYVLHLEGTVATVPVPAALWLFGSGMVGLFGFAKRRNI